MIEPLIVLMLICITVILAGVTMLAALYILDLTCGCYEAAKVHAKKLAFHLKWYYNSL